MTKKRKKITNFMPRPRLTIEPSPVGGGDLGYLGFVEVVQWYKNPFVCLKFGGGSGIGGHFKK